MQGMGMWAELTLMSEDQCRHLLKGSQVDNQSKLYISKICAMWELSLPEGLGKRGGFTMAFCLAYLQIYLDSILLHTIVLT